jgi:hypothetical protein
VAAASNVAEHLSRGSLEAGIERRGPFGPADAWEALCGFNRRSVASCCQSPLPPPQRQGIGLRGQEPPPSDDGQLAWSQLNHVLAEGQGALPTGKARKAYRASSFMEQGPCRGARPEGPYICYSRQFNRALRHPHGSEAGKTLPWTNNRPEGGTALSDCSDMATVAKALESCIIYERPWKGHNTL